MKKILFRLVISMVFINSCTKEEPASLKGRWEYYGNVGNSCDDLIGTIMDFDESNGIIVSVPQTVYVFTKQDTLYKEIHKISETSYYSEKALSKYVGGTVRYTRADINISADGKEMEIIYPRADVCNPSQKWRKK